MATGNFALPPPVPLDIHSDQAGEKWKRFKRAWDSYALATGLNGKDKGVQVATLFTVIGELREPALTLKRTDEICRSAESAVTQLRLVDDGQGTMGRHM